MALRLFIGVMVCYLFFRLIKRLRMGQKIRKNPPAIPGEDLVEDPNCHTYIPISRAYRESIGGKTLYFCSQACLAAYKEKHVSIQDRK